MWKRQRRRRAETWRRDSIMCFVPVFKFSPSLVLNYFYSFLIPNISHLISGTIKYLSEYTSPTPPLNTPTTSQCGGYHTHTLTGDTPAGTGDKLALEERVSQALSPHLILVPCPPLPPLLAALSAPSSSAWPGCPHVVRDVSRCSVMWVVPLGVP